MKTFDFWRKAKFNAVKHLKTSNKQLDRVYFTRKTVFNAVKLLDLAEISLAEEQDMNSEIFNKASSR